MLLHNPDDRLEGGYRLAEFSGLVDDIESNGEEFLTLVHAEKYIRKIKKMAEDREILAEVKLTKESYDAACIAAGQSV